METRCAAAATVFPMDGDYTPRQVAELVERDDVQLVDVREPYEVEAGRIAGGVHIELTELSARAAEIHREKPVIFYCRVGARSAMAAQAFQRAGYDAHNMTGGIEEWVAAGLPIEPEDGYVAGH
jgi:rhodanese-related sulfurtransferase